MVCGPYEILEYDSVLELLGPRCKSVIIKKRLRVKFLQDNITGFRNYARDDAQVLLDYHCLPGIIVDEYREGGRNRRIVKNRLRSILLFHS